MSIKFTHFHIADAVYTVLPLLSKPFSWRSRLSGTTLNFFRWDGDGEGERATPSIQHEPNSPDDVEVLDIHNDVVEDKHAYSASLVEDEVSAERQVSKVPHTTPEPLVVSSSESSASDGEGRQEFQIHARKSGKQPSPEALAETSATGEDDGGEDEDDDDEDDDDEDEDDEGFDSGTSTPSDSDNEDFRKSRKILGKRVPLSKISRHPPIPHRSRRFVQSQLDAPATPTDHADRGSNLCQLPKTQRNRPRRVLTPLSPNLPFVTVSMRADVQFFHHEKRFVRR